MQDQNPHLSRAIVEEYRQTYILGDAIVWQRLAGEIAL